MAGPYVVLLTDRTRLGAPVLAISRHTTRARVSLTAEARNAKPFRTKRKVREFLRGVSLDSRFLVTIERAE